MPSGTALHVPHNRWHPDIPPVLRCEPGDIEMGVTVRVRLAVHKGEPGAWLNAGRGWPDRPASPASTESAEPLLQVLTIHRRRDEDLGVQLGEQRLGE